MKPVVLIKNFHERGVLWIGRMHGDEDRFLLEHYDEVLNITLHIVEGGDTDGGSIPILATPIFDDVKAPTLHGYVIHDEIWRHRVMLKKLYKEVGLTFRNSNRIMQDVHRLAGCNWAEINLTRLGVRWGGYPKWIFPNKEVKNATNQTLFITKGDNRNRNEKDKQ